MSQPYFDTLKYAKLLIDHDFTQCHVQGLMNAQIMVLQSTFDKIVTPEDLRRSEYALRSDLHQLEHALRVDLIETEHRLNTQIKDVEQRLEAKITEVEHKLETKILETEHRLETKINALDTKITETASELKSFVLKNTLAMVLTMLGLNIGIAALVL